MRWVLGTCGALPVLALAPAPGARPADTQIALFFQAASADQKQAAPALAELSRQWRPGYAAMLVDLARFIVSSPRIAPPGEPTTLDVRGPAIPETGW